MQASLTLPPEANLTLGDNPVNIGNMSIGDSTSVNWTIVFTASGEFILDVNASGYREDTSTPVEEHGTAQVTARRMKLLSPTNKTYSTNAVLLNFYIADPISWANYSLNGEANKTIVGNTTLSGLPDGIHCLSLYTNHTRGVIESDRVCFTVDTIYPNITDVSQYPLKWNVLPDKIVKVNSSVTDNLRVKQMTLNYTTGNGTWISVEMEPLENNIWNATIQSFPIDTNITYTIVASDYANNTITTEELGYELEYIIIPEIPVLTLFASLLLASTAIILFFRKNKMFPNLDRR